MIVPARTISNPQPLAGEFAVSEPDDGGNLDIENSTLSASSMTLAVRQNENPAGPGLRWQPMLFKAEGMLGETTTFTVDITRTHGYLSRSSSAQGHFAPVWSTQYPGATWQEFDNYDRSTSGEITFWNDAPFASDTIYVSSHPKEAVSEFYDDLETRIFGSTYVSPSAGGGVDGDPYKIGEQPSGTPHNRLIPAQNLYGFQVAESARNPDKVVMLVSGIHPYEYNNKWGFRGFVDFIISEDPLAQTYRDHFTTLCYPHVNPTGEVAALWRGTAADVSIAMNQVWNSTGESVSADAHKSAMNADLTDVGGVFIAALDLHQSVNFRGETLPDDGYMFHIDNTEANNWASAVRAYEPDMDSDLSDPSGLDLFRSYATDTLGVTFGVTPERIIYDVSKSEEEAAGAAYAKALAERAQAGDYNS